MSDKGRQIIDALAAALVVSDLSEPRQRDAFRMEVEEAAKWAADADDPILTVAAAELLGALDALRDGSTEVAEGAEVLGQLIAAATEAYETSLSSSARSLPADGNTYASDPAIVADFVGGAVEQLEEAESLLSAAATGECVDVHALFRCMHTLKGMSGFLALHEMADVAHSAETVLQAARDEDRTITETEIEQSLASVDRMRRLVADVRATPASSAVDSGESASRSIRSADQIRVNAARLEDLLDAMGELAVAEAELSIAVKSSGDATAIRCLERLERIARDMQGTATALRMVSLKRTFAKMSRVVRDAVSRSDKAAELVISGEQTEIDRAIAEALVDPLVHLLRNAVDHGIESSGERAAAGKPAAGRIDVRAYHRSGSVFIEIEDDGRGIDPEVLTRRAIDSGLEFDQDRPLALIFRPGFSTADAITDLSGRGVGLDAVSAAVAGLRGHLDVSSKLGQGTRFTIRLPLTLAIIDGIVLRSGRDRYVVPTHFVERTASIVDAEVISAAGRGDVLVLPEGNVVVAPITDTMGGSLDEGNVAVLLADGDDRFAVLVDEVIGQQSLVIKPLTGPTAAAMGPAGAALMADGRVALVVDPGGLKKAMRLGC